jgi:protein TonB
MNNKIVTIFFLISVIIHAYFLFFIKFEPFKNIAEKKEKYTVIDLIDKKKYQKPAIKKPKSNLLAKKDINLKKKTETQKKDTKKPPTKKKTSISKPDKIPVKIQQKPEQKIIEKNKKETKEKVEEKNNKKIPERKLEKSLEKTKPIKKEKVVEKKENRIKEKKEVAPAKKNSNLPKSISDLDTEDIIEGFSKDDVIKSDKGDDVINLQAVGYKYISYFSKFKKLIENNWNYPRSSIMRGEQGSVRVKFSILKDGTITDIKFLNSSGYPQLDREVKRVLSEIKSYPLPKSWNKDRIKIEGNFIYELYGGYVKGRFE